MKRYFSTLFLLALALVPGAASAQVNLTNPLGETDVRIIIARLINGFLGISGSIALVMFIFGGIQWMTAAGKEDRVKNGKNTLIWAILGILVIASAYVATNAIFNAILTGSVSG
jgi:hypothetical protein